MSYGESSGQENDKNGLFLLCCLVLSIVYIYLTIWLLFIGFSYIDEIPVKIIEKYKPPKKIALPGVLQHKPTSNALKHQVRDQQCLIY